MNEELQHSSMTAINPTRAIKVFCWILGVSEAPFSVKIEESETVDDLKKGIVRENPATFAGVDSDELTLWMVCGFLHFDQVSYTPLLQGISPD